MTKDIVVVSETEQSKFARKVYQTVTELESNGYTCEIKFSTVEKDHSFSGVQFSALIHAYDAE